jgi:hypothetical protein
MINKRNCILNKNSGMLFLNIVIQITGSLLFRHSIQNQAFVEGRKIVFTTLEKKK